MTSPHSAGRSYLLDCEPWLHADRSYATRHAVAEQHCVSCIVANCNVCDDDYRHCDECDADHSLFVDPDTGVHSCVERGSCPAGFYSTNENSAAFVENGTAALSGAPQVAVGQEELYAQQLGKGGENGGAAEQPNLHECVEWLEECGSGQIEVVAPTSMRNRECDVRFSIGAVGGTVGGIVSLFVVIIVVVVLRHRSKVAKLKQELTKLGKTLVGVRHVKVAFTASGVTLPKGTAAHTTSTKTPSRKPTKRKSGHIGANVGGGGGGDGGMQTRWYWQEGADRINSHNKHDVLQPGNWVSYAWGVCAELDQKYADWQSGQNNGTFPIDLTNRIASTGTEAKAHGGNTGVKFSINFNQMCQKNVQSGFTRPINRVEVTPAVSEYFLGGNADAHIGEEFTAITVHPRYTLTGDDSISNQEPTTTDTTISKADSKDALPSDLIGEDDKVLMLSVGQLVQQHNIRDDGWAFGTILHHGDVDKDAAIPMPGVDYETGWFPLKCTELAATEHLEKLQAKLGEGALQALEPPAGWKRVRDAMVAERFELAPGSQEFNVVSGLFLQTLHSSTQVISVQRIQNMAMWQSYAMQRQLMATRDQKDPREAEKRWLFHGTSADTVPKIIQQGFNRGFAGKNATMYGKGVYFAKNASYSASTTYSPPDGKGVQSMFLVRVLTGFTCRGIKDAPAPNMRIPERNIAYDTTTNADKSIYVTYHDAQQYPEYLVQFK